MTVRRVTLIILMVLSASGGWACDVDLEKILFGGKGEDPFFKTISQLASYTQAIGKTAGDATVAQQNLKTLMNAWIDFDNRYSRKPPEWATTDQKWTEKIKSLTGLIGKIRQYVDEAKVNELHSSVTELHGRILLLVEAMPMSDLSKKLLAISGLFCEAEAAERMDEPRKLREVVGGLVKLTADLEALLPEPQKKIGKRLMLQLEKFNMACATETAQLTMDMKMLNSITNDQFKKINQSLAASGEPGGKE